MRKRWDSWLVTFAGAVIGLMASVAHIVIDRSNVDVGPVAIGYVLIYIAAGAGIFAAVSVLHNRRAPLG